MASSGSTGRANNGDLSGLDLSSDPFHQIQTDLSIGFNSQDLSTTQMSKSSKYPPTSYSPPEESSLNHDMLLALENSVKKSTDNVMCFLEGISSRLSQLELYCYNIDKSVGQMRSNFDRDQEETDLKLTSVQKHLQEVLRAVQVLRDKQELAETQKELVKLQLTQRVSSTNSSVQQDEDNATPREAKKGDHSPDLNGLQLALAVPHHVVQQLSLPSRPVDQPLQPPLGPAPPISQSMSQTQAYYLSPPQMTTLLVSNQALKGQCMPPNSQYQASQMQDLPRVVTQQPQSRGNQNSQHQSMSTYQQQWSQQVQQLPQSSVQPQVKVSSASPYPSYMPIQQNPPMAGMVPNSSSMQAPFLGSSQAHASPQEVLSYGYGGTGGPIQDQAQPTQQHPTASDGYTLAPGNTYFVYDGEGGRAHHHPPLPSHVSQGGYSTVIIPVQNPQTSTGPSPMIRPPQFVRHHSYNELIDQLANRGYRSEHIVGAIQRLEESGQPVDFGAVLDRLNGRSSGSPHSGWSAGHLKDEMKEVQ